MPTKHPITTTDNLRIFAEVEKHGDRTFTRLSFSISSTHSFCGGPAQWPEPVWAEVHKVLEKFRLATEVIDPDAPVGE